MKATYKTKSGRLVFETEGESAADIVTELAKVQEIFDETHCGVCKSENIRWQHRVVDENSFYEMLCLEPKCRAKLECGQHKKPKGSLFFKRKIQQGDKEVFDVATRGWKRWDGKKEEKK